MSLSHLYALTIRPLPLPLSAPHISRKGAQRVVTSRQQHLCPHKTESRSLATLWSYVCLSLVPFQALSPFGCGPAVISKLHPQYLECKLRLLIVSISIAGHLLTVVNPTTATASAHLAPDDQAEVNANNTTWALSTEALETAMAMIWSRVAAHKAPLTGLPLIGHTCNLFPYQTLDGIPSVNSMEIMILIGLI